jgi:hypothetical protein
MKFPSKLTILSEPEALFDILLFYLVRPHRGVGPMGRRFDLEPFFYF